MVASAGGRIRSDSSRLSAGVGDPDRAYAVEELGERGGERRLVAGLDGALEDGVELVEPVERVVRDVVLPLAEDPDDHR